jgi:hypothetical protein
MPQGRHGGLSCMQRASSSRESTTARARTPARPAMARSSSAASAAVSVRPAVPPSAAAA